MKAATCLLFAAVAACAGTEQPSQVPSPAENPSGSGATSRQAVDDPARALTTSECASLGESLADICSNRSGTRSAQIEGWCSDLVSAVGDGSWVAGDCVNHIKYLDSVCFRNAGNPGELMDCDRAVTRP
jgi:hypothetical protein